MALKAKESALSHFKKRSAGYNRSSNWVIDEVLLGQIFAAADAGRSDSVLDIATGTGLVAKQFKGKVKEVVGLDISPEMTRQASAFVDRMVIAPYEKIPLADGAFDACVCRQGLQFSDLAKALAEVLRVLKPGGRVAFCHLACYGEEDAAEAFKIQALRNPSRVNFFKPGDLESSLKKAGFDVAESALYRSRESVDQWIQHGASTPEERRAIKDAYRDASPAFKKLHEVERRGGDFLDTMPFLIIRAQKPS
jgi:DNA gyrase subunit B